MNPKTKVLTPRTRTRTSCLVCRSRKVKCDKVKPSCSRCTRLDRMCNWEEAIEYKVPAAKSKVLAINPENISELLEYFKKRTEFLVYPYDGGNLFRSLAHSEPLQYSMAAVAASLRQDEQSAIQHYVKAVEALGRSILSNHHNGSALGSCLLLCVYEILSSGNGFKSHLEGASILLRCGRLSQEFSHLKRFCHLLDVSDAILSSRAPLLDYYWKDGHPDLTGLFSWPRYNTKNVAVTSFQGLMELMARLACFSQSTVSGGQLDYVQERDFCNDLRAWWEKCPSAIRCQSNDWRQENREKPLATDETLLQEQFTSIRACMHRCYLYLQHILDPLGRESMKPEGCAAVREIWEIINKAPPGHGLELGLEWSVFMLGISIFNDLEKETIIRAWFQTKRRSIFPANALVLLEAL